MYVYLIYGNNLRDFRQSAIDFHRAVALMQLQLRTRDLSSWWWWWMSNQWCMKLPLLAVCIDVVESSFMILFKRFQLLFWDFYLPVASNSQGPETMLMLSCHVIVDTLSATSRGYNSCNLVLCLTTTAKDKGGIILVRTLQALWKSIKSYNLIIIMILISNTVYIQYEIHSNTIKCYNSTHKLSTNAMRQTPQSLTDFQHITGAASSKVASTSYQVCAPTSSQNHQKPM